MPTVTDPTTGQRVFFDHDPSDEELANAFQPGWGTTAAEMVGGTLGALGGSAVGTALGGPGIGTLAGGVAGAGAGTALGGALADQVARGGTTPGPALERGVTGAAGELVSAPIAAGAGKLGRMGAQALGRRYPKVASAIERVAPGAFERGPRAAAAIRKVGAPMAPLAAGEQGIAAIGQSLAGRRSQVAALDDAIHQVIGRERVVPTEGLRQAWTSLVEQTAHEPLGMPRGTGRIGKLFRGAPGEAREQVTAELVEEAAPVVEGQLAGAATEGAGRAAVGTLPPGGQLVPRTPEGAQLWQRMGRTPRAAQVIVEIEEAIGNDLLDFDTARRLESQLGKLASGPGGTRMPIGTGQQRDAARLYDAFRGDLDSFYETPLGNQIHPDVQELKAIWKQTKEEFNESVVARLWQRNPERFVQTVFRPGNVTEVAELRRVVPPDVFDTMVATHLEGLFQKAGQQGEFKPALFGRSLRALDDTGQLEAMVGAERRAQLVNLADEFLAQTGQQSGPPLASRQLLGTAGKALAYGTIGGLGLRMTAPSVLPEHGMQPPSAPGLAAAAGLLAALDPAGRAVGRRMIGQAAAQRYVRPLWEDDDALRALGTPPR